MVTWAQFARSQYHTVLLGAIGAYAAKGEELSGSGRSKDWAPDSKPSSSSSNSNSTEREPNFNDERDLTALPAPHFSSVSCHVNVLPHGQLYDGGHDFWLSSKPTMVMLVPTTDAEVERQADEAAIAWVNSVMGASGTGAVLSDTKCYHHRHQMSSEGVSEGVSEGMERTGQIPL